MGKSFLIGRDRHRQRRDARYIQTLQEASAYIADPEKAFCRRCGSPLAQGSRLSAVRFEGALVHLRPENLVLQGMQEAVHDQGWRHLR